MDNSRLLNSAKTLGELHGQGRPLVLPTVWDAWSARTSVAAGFSALTIGSHPLADSRGEEDHEGQSFEGVVDAARRIVKAVRVPISLDLESGYGQNPADLIAGLLESGAVGLNVEDTVHSEGGRVRTTAEHASYIAGLRAAADDAGVPVWINGRTDLFMHAEDKAAVAGEAIARMQALVAAGADSVYPVFIQDDDDLIAAVVADVPAPVNCTAHPTRHTLARFTRLGVGRVTYGPLLQSALTDAMTTMISGWRG
jgi:2-methylisocitrate lyase-like PEP mutase family enzyme